MGAKYYDFLLVTLQITSKPTFSPLPLIQFVFEISRKGGDI